MAAFANSAETLKMLDLFGDVFEKVRQEYVEAPEDKELLESAINGMLRDLDPHSSYLNAETFKEMQVQTKGEFGGLGIEVTMKDGLVYVVSPIDDTPAYNAGVEAGDYISHIDEESVVGMTIKDAVERMRGKPKTPILVTILREGEDEPFDIEIIRDIITIKAVKSKIYDDIAYLRVTTFSEQTVNGAEEQLKTMLDEIDDNIKGLVLDLRSNPGGLLTQAIGLSDMFLDKGEVLSTRGRRPESAKRFNATAGDMMNGLPIAVLINGGSASASEIVAGALQDHRRALILGTKSFGKGSVQTVIPLDKENAIKVTTSRYYTPSGRSIQAEGIEPDIIVENADISLKKEKRQRKEADLKGQIGKGDLKNDKEPANDNDPKGVSKLIDEVKKEEGEAENIYETDYQLGRAIDLLRGLYLYNQADESTNISQYR